jgi:tetratricopeptide (TPR) repeat protein
MAEASEFNLALDAFNRGDLDRAREIASRELESGDDPKLQHLMGLIECRSGRLSKGIEWLRLASEGEPENIGFRVMVVRALVDAGRAKQALGLATIPAGTTPAELALLHARAEAADEAADIPQAIDAWGRLCRAGVRDWRAWANYGHALAAADRWSDAEPAFRSAVELAPDEPSLRRTLSATLAQCGRNDEAADELLRWMEHAPDDVENGVFLARLLVDFGRDTESVEQLDKIVRETIGRPLSESYDRLIDVARSSSGEISLPVVTELARFLERSNNIEALRKLLQDSEAQGVAREQLAYPAAAVALQDRDPEAAKRLLQSTGPDADPPRWHWLMARIFDALNEPESAFGEAQEMNRSAPDRANWLARGRNYVEAVRAVASAATPEWAARIRPLEPPARRSPVFLVGFPRSGTTLLDTFLMGHPGAAVLEEVPLMAAAQQSLGDGPDLPDRSVAELEAARSAYFAGLDEHVEADFDGLVIDKLPLNMLAPRFIHTLFPDAKLIFAQRHPCDCVLSCFMQAFALNNSMASFLEIESAADFYDAAMTLWTRFNELLPLNVHTIVYEDLVADPEATLRPLVDFLGLDWRGELLDHVSTARARGTIHTPSYAQVTQPLTRRASGRWKRYRKQLEPVLPVLLPWAERLGYRGE